MCSKQQCVTLLGRPRRKAHSRALTPKKQRRRQAIRPHFTPGRRWGSVTPTELEVEELVQESLSNKDIGTTLFISPRTVQTLLTRVYTELGLDSRMQLAQEAARHG